MDGLFGSVFFRSEHLALAGEQPSGVHLVIPDEEGEPFRVENPSAVVHPELVQVSFIDSLAEREPVDILDCLLRNNGVQRLEEAPDYHFGVGHFSTYLLLRLWLGFRIWVTSST